MKERTEMSLETQTTGGKLGKWDPAKRTCANFGDTKRPKEGDAKMRWEAVREVLDRNFVSLRKVVVKGREVTADLECGAEKCEAGL